MFEVLMFLSKESSADTDALSKANFPRIFGEFCKNQGDKSANHPAQARSWVTGATAVPNKNSRPLLASFFTHRIGMLPQYKGIILSDDIFEKSVVIDEFMKRMQNILPMKLPASISGEENFTIELPVKKRRVNDIISTKHHHMEELLSGYKLVFRRALENTIRVCREVIKFEIHENEINFRWWFQRDGGHGRSHRDINDGILMPFQNCNIMLGVHDTHQQDQLRFRMAVIEHKRPSEATDPVQAGLITSTHPQSFYPVSGRMLWVTIQDSVVGEEEKKEEFLDRTIGFFHSIEQSFAGTPAKPRTIRLIKQHIQNKVPQDRMLSTEMNGGDKLEIISDDWEAITKSFHIP
jgi:hypothetical protein